MVIFVVFIVTIFICIVVVVEVSIIIFVIAKLDGKSSVNPIWTIIMQQIEVIKKVLT